MGRPFSVTFSDIYKAKIKNEVVTPLKPKFYRRFVDDIFIFDVKKMFMIFFSTVSKITIKTLSLALKSVQLNSLTQN